MRRAARCGRNRNGTQVIAPARYVIIIAARSSHALGAGDNMRHADEEEPARGGRAKMR